MNVLVPREEDFHSRLRSPTVTARVGLWLGVCFGTAFVTGVISHFSKVPHTWVPFPTRPSWGYRVTQGLHVASGTASVPLLLVKLWTVYPKLFARPPRRLRALLAHGAERVSIAVLVAAAIFELVTGLANVSEWYPWQFSFSHTHYAVGWIAIGALLVHVGVKLPLIRSALASDLEEGRLDRPSTSTRSGALSRRGLLRTTWGAAGIAVLATAGAGVPWLRQVSVLASRSGDGPQDVPVRTSAATARVTALATHPSYALTLVYGGHEQHLTRAQLSALPQTTAALPIACVEGWSAGATWRGVRLRDLLDRIGAPPGRDVTMFSLQPSGPFRYTTLPDRFADDPSTLVALELNGQPLSIDHGYPCRLIAPDRPGELQTKWLSRIEVAT